MMEIDRLLLYPFEKGHLQWPQEGDAHKICLYGAAYQEAFREIVNCDPVTPFKTVANGWEEKGYSVDYTPMGEAEYDICLCHLSPQKEAAKGQIAACLTTTKPDGIVVFMAANNAGGNRIEKWVSEIGLKGQSLSKNKCRIVWVEKTATINNKILQQWQSFDMPQYIEVGDSAFYTWPGIYGWNKVDAGSVLLNSYIPDDISGVGADFGCGYGYLSVKSLQKPAQTIKKLYVMDADWRALHVCRKNIEDIAPVCHVTPLWCDLRYRVERLPVLDWIIMNPPFHDGKKTDHDIGIDFIKNAYASLKVGGHLYMVANAHLPYEDVLKKTFRSVIKETEENGFKVFVAVK